MIAIVRPVCVVLLFLGCCSLSAVERDGKLLLRYCTATVNALDGAQADKDQLPDDFSCLVYIAGFTDALEATSAGQDLSGQQGARALDGICAPHTKVEQSARLFVEYARQHPEYLHLPAGDVLLLALRHAFPCPAGK